MTILWADDDGSVRVPSAAGLTFAKARAEKLPDQADAHMALGAQWEDRHCWPEALTAYRRAFSLRPDDTRSRLSLANALVRAGQRDEAIRLLDDARGDSDEAKLIRCQALWGLGRGEEAAETAGQLLAESGSKVSQAAEILLAVIAARGDGGALLAACDALPGSFANSAVELAFRAMGLSLMGRGEEARAIVDPGRQIGQYRFEPPQGFESQSAFNAKLAEEIFEQIGAEGLKDERWKMRHVKLSRMGAPAYGAFLDWLRPAIEAHIETCRAAKSDRLLETLPERARIYTETFVCRRGGHNGIHMHRGTILSGVYHVAVPSDLTGDRGHLFVGLPSKGLEGHATGWQQARVVPVPGMLTLFPAYVFHDFVATHSEEWRIAIGLGVQPA